MKLIFLPLAFLLTACSPSQDIGDFNQDLTKLTGSAKLAGLSVLFDSDALVVPMTEVDCTLSEGTRTRCLSITLKPEPSHFQIGPWCPRSISDGPDVSGIWLEGGKVYDADGSFIQSLDRFYEDTTWQMFDPETGKINVTDTKISCAAAARPDVDPEYQNHCVECQVSYMEPGLSQTYVIPLNPNPAKQLSNRVSQAGVGVAFSGVRLDAPAPTEAILSAHTLAPFDDCGGHVNLHVGYHMHAVTDKEGCHQEVSSLSGHAPQIGLAMDGYAIHVRVNEDGQEPSDLDSCRGHEIEGLDYHYHANAAGANAILTCHRGETGCAQSDVDTECRADQSLVRRGPPGDRPPPPGRE